MKKRLTLFLTTIVLLVIFSLTCSAAGTISYVAAQSWPAASTFFTETMSSAATAIDPVLADDPTLSSEGPAPQLEAGERNELVPSDDPKAEYYRAVFDVCIYSAHKAGAAPETAVSGCQDFVRRAIAGNWFEEPSRGWEWPLRYQLPASGA